MLIPRIIALTIGFIAGIIIGSFVDIDSSATPYIVLLVCVGSLIYSAWIIYGEYKWKVYSRLTIFLPLILAGLALGFFRAYGVLHYNSSASNFFHAQRQGDKLQIRGTIVAEPELRSSRTLQLRVRLSQLKKVSEKHWHNVFGDDIRITLSRPRDKKGKEFFKLLSSSEAYGYTIECTTTYTIPQEAVNPGGFNMKSFLLAEGYIADLKVYDWKKSKKNKGAITEIQFTKGFFLMEFALSAKRSFIRTFKYSIPPPACRLISGATLGTRFALRGIKYRGKLIEESFRHSGVGHVLAVSGLHVSVVALLLFSIFKMTRIPPRYFAPVMILLLFLFTLLTGARPSSLRASIMNAVIILIFVYGGSGFKRATYAGLALAGMLILIRRPMVLYSAGFLLSFGAVLSLVLISPLVDRTLKQLRGAAFILALLWFAGIICFASLFWEVFLNWPMIILCVTFLAACLYAGSFLNRKFPVLLKFSFDRIPNILRLFLVAQIAIQFGMMIPMSAYFFGNFPIAGMFVNLVAIPLVGVIVQLGILIGLAGLIPVIGPFLALTLGAANWLTGSFFIITAWLGSVVFPYPPVPKPSSTWIIVYYLIILLLLGSQFFFKQIQTFLYKIYKKSPVLIPVFCIVAMVLTGSVASYKVLNPVKTGALVLDIPAGTSIPVLAVTGDPQGALIINAGNTFFATRDLKSLLLARGAINIHAAFASAHAPGNGAEGFAALITKMRISDIYFPTFIDMPNGKLSINSVLEKYAEGIGIKNVSKKQKYWLRRCHRAYNKMLQAVEASSRKIHLHSFSFPNEIRISKEIMITPLTTIYKTYPAVLMLHIREKKILIIGDPGNRNLAKLPAEILKCDILVLGAPLGSGKYYVSGIKKLLTKITPQQIVICFDNRPKVYKKNKRLVSEIMSFMPSSEVTITQKTGFSKVF